MERPRLIFVEGIMGSGKSTTARWLARLYRRMGIPALPVPEARPHPANVFRTLPHWRQPWLDLTAEELMTHSYASWQAFVDRALSRRHLFAFDGHSFMGILAVCSSWRARLRRCSNMCTQCCNLRNLCIQ
jgi:hypothetical protein